MTPHVFPIFERLLRRGPSTTFTGFPFVVGKNEMLLHHSRQKLPLDYCRMKGFAAVEAQKVQLEVDVPALAVAVEASSVAIGTVGERLLHPRPQRRVLFVD